MLRAPLPTTLNYNLAIHSNDSFWTVQKDQASLSAVLPTTPRRPVQAGRLPRTWVTPGRKGGADWPANSHSAIGWGTKRFLRAFAPQRGGRCCCGPRVGRSGPIVRAVAATPGPGGNCGVAADPAVSGGRALRAANVSMRRDWRGA